MQDYRYQLEKGSKKHICPGCGKRRFVRYFDHLTKEYLPNHYGRCDRAINCAYHLNPYKEGFGKDADKVTRKYSPISQPRQDQVSFIAQDVYRKSLSGYPSNNFYNYLCSLFHSDIANALLHRFNIGSSRYWVGSTVFWQVDTALRVRSGKVMLYDPVSGKREKQVLQDGSTKSLITWVHAILKIDGFSLKQCLFGLHQLVNTSIERPVAIVESEKTAIIATVYLPHFIWLACGSLTNLTAEKLAPLRGRQIILFPDLGAYELWVKKATPISQELTCRIIVSRLLEDKATQADKLNGLDLADYLIRKDHTTGWALTDQNYPFFWDNSLSLPANIGKGELFQQETLKCWKQGRPCDVYELALNIGLELSQAIAICEELSTNYGVVFG